MFNPIDFDPAMVSPWPVMPVHPQLDVRVADARAGAAANRILIETKAAAEPTQAEALQDLLNQMTVEMRLQFEAFRKIRIDAEKLLEGPADDSTVKIAKADIKSANDALSLIVRTLEKIDSLQRSLADDRERATEQNFDQAAYDELLAGIERKIEARARELASAMAGQRGGDAAAGRGPPGSCSGTAERSHTSPG
ncbi:hypothetical protein JJB09_03370 [Rhizobium sp. KVB221]|uniref:Uncharacterized protein n=1 Tax=Rhizobium setariae TaxID=2801340 RepID=A0A936YK46_9HYPH|nr:hypothetical protein [Rhizobium setariae]MBL0371058.1 hypothetical protein [Rhizobium setariae]